MLNQEGNNIKLYKNNLNEKQPIIKTIIIILIFLLIGTSGYITTNQELGLLIVLFFVGLGIYILPIIILLVWIIYYIKLSIKDNRINKKIFYKPLIIAIASSVFCFICLNLVSEVKTSELVLPEFVEKRFYREIPGCGENIGFSDDYTMYYYEDCGNPVDNFDLCENYSYKKATNEIIIKCDGFTEKFKVIKYVPGKELTLVRNNKTLIFEEVER